MKKFLSKIGNGILCIYNLLVNNEDNDSKRIQRIIFGILILFIYSSINIIAGRNPLAVFRSLPVLDKRAEISVFFPDTDGKNIFEEKRKIRLSDEYEIQIREIVEMIIKGSNFENTRLAVPIEGIIRSIWIDKNRCIIDFRLASLDESAIIIPGSEDIFKEAVTRSVKKNIPGIDEVLIMENGIFGRHLWEP